MARVQLRDILTPQGPRGGHGPAPRPRPGPISQLDEGDLRRGRRGAARDLPESPDHFHRRRQAPHIWICGAMS